MRVSFHFNDQQIDITDALRFPLAITKEVSEFRDINSGRGSRSKQFTVLATKDNNNAFASLYDLDVDQSAAGVILIKSKVDAAILVDDIPVLKGYARIFKLSNRHGQPQEYQITVFGDNADWISQLRGAYLNDLDFGTTTWNKSNVQTIQAQSYPTTDFNYPLIDYGKFEYSDGVGTEDFYPAPYICSLITKIFNAIGYKVTSKWMDESDIQGLIFPLVGTNWRHSDIVIDANSTESSLLATYTANGSDVISPVNFPNEITDPSGLMSIGSYYVGQYAVGVETSTPGNFTGNVFSPALTGRYKISGVVTIENTDASDATFTFYSYEIGTQNMRFGESYSIASGATVDIYLDHIFDITGGETYGFLFMTDADHEYQIGSTLDVSLTDEITVGADYSVGGVLPKISQLDFITGLKELFGLQIKADTIEREVTIEPRNDWWNSASSEVNGFYLPITSAVDWSDKLDLSKIDVEIVSEHKKTLEYGYNVDSSDGRMNYVNENRDLRYGSQQYDLEDRFPDGIQKLTNKLFAATTFEYNSDLNTTGARLLTPLLLKNNVSTPQDKSLDFAPRILRYKYTSEANRYGETVALQYYEDSGSAPNSEETSIPKAYFVNYDSLSDFQLTFGSVTGGTGLFERYHLFNIPEINDGRLITAKMHLKGSDVVHNLRALVYIDGIYYIVNKIKDYKPTANQLTTVELVPRNTLIASGVTALDDDANSRLAAPGTDGDLDVFFEDSGNVLGVMVEDTRGNVTRVKIDDTIQGARELIPYSKWQ